MVPYLLKKLKNTPDGTGRCSTTRSSFTARRWRLEPPQSQAGAAVLRGRAGAASKAAFTCERLTARARQRDAGRLRKLGSTTCGSSATARENSIENVTGGAAGRRSVRDYGSTSCVRAFAAAAILGALCLPAWLRAATDSSLVADAAQAGDRQVVTTLIKQAPMSMPHRRRHDRLHWAARETTPTWPACSCTPVRT